jgi:hypothetical protein
VNGKSIGLFVLFAVVSFVISGIIAKQQQIANEIAKQGLFKNESSNE